MSSYGEKRRTARKAHRCDGCDRPTIKPGDVYREAVTFPGSDWHPDGIGPRRLRECAVCAGRYGRDHLIGKMPEEQASRVYAELLRHGWL